MEFNEKVVRDSQSIANEWWDYFKGLHAHVKKGKACGEDNIFYEHILYCDPLICKVLSKLFTAKFKLGISYTCYKRAIMALYRLPEYHSTQGEYDLIRGTFLPNYFEIRP